MTPKKTQYGDYATWIYFPILARYAVRLIITDNLAKSFGERLGEGRLGGCTDGCCFHDKNGQTWMFLSDGVSQGTVAHEAFHVMYEIHDYIGAKVENEMLAYHLGYLVNEVEKFRDKVKRVKATKSFTKKEASDGQNTRTSSKKRG
jgi:hypothetical protein